MNKNPFALSSAKRVSKGQSIFKGFTLLELVIGIAIAAIISVVLFNSFYQTYKTVNTIDQMISIDRRAAILQNQLDKDITSIFIPPLENEKIERVFYSVNSQKNLLKEFTFITTNSLQVYKSTSPRVVRVTYQIHEDRKLKDSYILQRKESTNLAYGVEKDAIGYELINDIKSFSINFISEDSSKKSNDSQKISTEWIAKSELKNESYKIPKTINIKIVLWDGPNHKKEQYFEFKFTIYSPHEYKKTEPKKEKSKLGKDVKQKTSEEEKDQINKLLDTVKKAMKL